MPSVHSPIKELSNHKLQDTPGLRWTLPLRYFLMYFFSSGFTKRTRRVGRGGEKEEKEEEKEGG